ncbi:DeoR family transcriptional regulator, partial [Paraburkholderia sp.]|uniref:DeoR family transcriptional regulator n=1 Tax=Paraburkholderia sp. TaxID=1926495 RepID=UPI00345C65EB
MGSTTARNALGLNRRARRTRRRDVCSVPNPFSARRMPRKLCTMLNQPRLDEIVRLLSQQQRVKSIDLATSFGVSEETIRR